MSALLELAVDDKHHGRRAVLRDVRLALAPGEIVSLIGASGCGKSTLLSIAAVLDRDYRGAVRLAGRALHGPDPGVGLVFQEPRLFPWLTVAQNVVFGAARNGDQVRAGALLEEVGVALPQTCEECISDVGMDAVDPGFDLLDRVNILHESLIDDGQHRFPGIRLRPVGRKQHPRRGKVTNPFRMAGKPLPSSFGDAVVGPDRPLNPSGF